MSQAALKAIWKLFWHAVLREGEKNAKKLFSSSLFFSDLTDFSEDICSARIKITQPDKNILIPSQG